MLDENQLHTAIDKYQHEQKELQNPLIKLIEANQNKLAELKTQKAKLIDGYTKGVFTLDEIAPNKVEIDDQIAKLNEAIITLQGELSPTTLTHKQIIDIHEFAAKVRMGLGVADEDFAARRKVVELLRVQVTLSVIDEKKYADVECILGNKRLATENGPAGQYCCRLKINPFARVNCDYSY